MRAVKKNEIFAIYATSMSIFTSNTLQEISDQYKYFSDQYKYFKDTLEKKNIDILLQYRPYDCAIELQEKTQPPFGPTCNLSKTELAALCEYIDENLARNFI